MILKQSKKQQSGLMIFRIQKKIVQSLTRKHIGTEAQKTNAGQESEMNYHTVTDEKDDFIWSLLLEHAGEEFRTARGLPFTYSQKISRTGEMLGELVIDRKEKTVTRNTVLLAYQKALELMGTEGCVSGPKKLGVFGASYIYPVFLALGICRKKPMEQENSKL